MSKFPEENKKIVDKNLEEGMEIIKKIIDSSYSARQKAKLKLRWPIKKVLIVSKDKKLIKSVKKLNEVLKRMCNAKEIEVRARKPRGKLSEVEFDLGRVLIDKKLDKELLEEALIRELIREIQALRKKGEFEVKEKISLTLNSDKNTNKILEKYVESLRKEVGAEEILIGEIKGKFKGELSFDKKKINLAFSKL
jgi:isoleucyl-tRNA synthetase